MLVYIYGLHSGLFALFDLKIVLLLFDFFFMLDLRLVVSFCDNWSIWSELLVFQMIDRCMKIISYVLLIELGSCDAIR